MSEISMIESLLMFNQRVLSLGNIIPDFEYTINDLKDTIKFNQIYMSNMNELFRTQNKYRECINNYMSDMKILNNQMKGIIEKIQSLDNTIVIDNDYNSFECRYSVMNLIKNNLNVKVLTHDELYEYNFKSEVIYYLISINKMYIISYLDPKSSIYQTPISYEFDTYKKYWKTDLAILEYLKYHYGNKAKGITLKISKSRKTRKIVKFDMNGSDEDVKYMSIVFSNYIKLYDIFTIKNEFMYTDDIEQIIKTSRLYKKPDITIDIYSYKNYKEDFSLSDVFKKDIIIEYPNDSFDNYLRLLHLASIDTRTESIYITLYRIGDNPIIYYILSDAVRRGVKVHVNLELRASEESINKFWANEMTDAGIDVSHYADGYLKVHCKLTLIKFKNGEMISQIGTGNYHSQTTTQYTDLSLMTANQKICKLINSLFELIVEGNENLLIDDNLLITRYNARNKLSELITEQGNLGPKGNIFIKCNSFNDKKIGEYLDIAAVKGCKINLIIRGVCTWIPPDDTLNKNVTIKSIVWDKLEHSRLYVFGEKNPTIYLGSLDLMTHKLDDRIETLVKLVSGNTIEIMCKYITRYTNFPGWYMIRNSKNKIEYQRK